MDTAPDVKTGWHTFADYRVQFLKFHPFTVHFGQCHAAADINADDIRHDALPDRHRQTDRADFSRVDVWHDADFAALGNRVVAEHLELGGGVIVQLVFRVGACEYFRACVGSVYCFYSITCFYFFTFLLFCVFLLRLYFV